MEAAAHGHSTLGIPKSVGKEFVAADAGTFDESKHPRGEDGKFGSGGGGSSSESSSPKVGPFGPILTNFKGDAQGAIKALTEMQDGEAIGALHHPEIGDIDLIWGKAPGEGQEGYGLAKLVNKHPEVLNDLQGILSSMSVVQPSGKNRVRLSSATHRGVVRLSWDGESKSWLMTAFEPGKERGGEITRTDTDSLAGADDTASRADASEVIVDQVIADFQAKKDKGRNGRIDCAGILFRAPGPLYLLVKRSDTGEWEQPGGHADGDETPEQAAVRECVEEIGGCPEGLRWAARRNAIPGGAGEYTCFLQNVPEPFKPALNDEHTAWQWAAPGELPEKMHPAVAQTIELLTGNELDIAKRVAAGELLSPQQYENVWLFDLRITGTGTSYRMALDEYVYRPPENFLTDEFLERCNGLPVIFEHPEKSILSTEEYRARAIGTIVLPYIKGDEVWGIAKIFDADAAALMCSTHASTSPAVIFRNAGSAESVEIDGKSVLIEGNPSYLDHLAVCQEGVWDKGGEPSGVNTGDPEMDGMEEQVPAWADALGKRLDSVCSRMDAIENKGGDQMPAKPMAADGNPAAEAAGAAEHEHEAAAARELAEAEAAGAVERRADSAETEEEKEKREKEAKERADSAARADAQGRLERENAELRARIERMDGRIASMTKPLSTEDRDALATAQMRADSVMQMFGQSAAQPLHGESPIDYRRRLAAKLQSHSSDMKGVKLDSIDGPAFKLVEDRIYADAQSAALNPAAAPAGRLIPLVSRDEAGRQITRFTGDIDAWMGYFKAPGVVCKVNRQAKGA
ncbi:NUDIX domain-containing protein [Burkholderia gladioli]|uniref:NUDIX domain-containing protein n=1 Tax=Burkholderia gladioli TaxID=28095 RepID=UPI00163ECFF7|nr:NUDIX domain-containing protein [Burkholderia gladioli]